MEVNNIIKKVMILLVIIGGLLLVYPIEETEANEGNYELHMIEPELSEEAVFEDENIKVDFWTSNTAIHFRLTNKLDQSIKLIWDNVSLVDNYRDTSRVIKSGVRYVDKESTLSPSVIPSDSSIVDLAAPTNKIYYSNGWRQENLFTKDTLGENFGIYFPIEINGQIVSYDFKFRQVSYPKKELVLKDGWKGGMWSFFLPTAGYFYAGNWTTLGKIAGGARIALLYLNPQGNSENGSNDWIHTIYWGIALVEIYDVVNLISENNEELLNRRKEEIRSAKNKDLSFIFSPDLVGVSYKF